MFADVLRVLTGRIAVTGAWAAVLALAAVWGLTLVSAQQTQKRLEGRIAALDAKLARASALREAEAAACAAGQPALIVAGSPPTSGPAEKLLREPAGFDVCARMESADQAVLESLG